MFGDDNDEGIIDDADLVRAMEGHLHNDDSNRPAAAAQSQSAAGGAGGEMGVGGMLEAGGRWLRASLMTTAPTAATAATTSAAATTTSAAEARRGQHQRQTPPGFSTGLGAGSGGRYERGSRDDEDDLYIYDDYGCLLYTSPSPRDKRQSRMPSSA